MNFYITCYKTPSSYSALQVISNRVVCACLCALFFDAMYFLRFLSISTEFTMTTRMWLKFIPRGGIWPKIPITCVGRWRGAVGRGGTAAGQRRDTGGTPAGHRRHTAGHRRDTGGTPAGPPTTYSHWNDVPTYEIAKKHLRKPFWHLNHRNSLKINKNCSVGSSRAENWSHGLHFSRRVFFISQNRVCCILFKLN